MTDQQPEVPWGESTPEQQASYERYEAAHSDRYYNVPARSPEMRAEYDRQEEAEREIEAAEERNIHFFGHYPTDPYVEHGEYCVDSCPYDTPEQARERAGLIAHAEAQEAEYAGMEAGQ